jgi:putative addiction module component (TIGR02574 family)
MNPTFEQMIIEERILYLQDLWDRVAEAPDEIAVGEDLKRELDRRLAAHQANPSGAIPHFKHHERVTGLKLT